MIKDDIKQILDNWVTAFWTDHNTDVVADTFAEDVVYRDVAWGLVYRGHDALKTYMTECIKVIPDFNMELTEAMQTRDDTFSVQWDYGGTFTLGEQRTPFRLSGMSILKIKDGKITSCFDYYDGQDWLDAIGFPDHDVDSFNAMMAAAAERKKEKLAQSGA